MTFLALATVALCLAQEAKNAKDAGPPLPEGEGKELVSRMCNKCHGPAVFTKTRMGRVGWEDQVSAMVEKGAVGTEEEIQIVVDYLVKNFGRDSKPGAAAPEKVNVNKATAKQLETALGLSAKEAETLVQYREKNGNFREWGDLGKIPDVDVKKLEGKKAGIEF
jgi:competence ComEA-like helix-hairpin-helix protein